MSRRLWPAALAALSIVVLGSFLLYTQFIVRQVRHNAAVMAAISGHVYSGLLALDEPGAAAQALIDVRDQLQRLDVPIIYYNAAGEITATNNLPFDEPDLLSGAGQRQVGQYAVRLLAQDSASRISLPDAGEIIFGDSRFLSQLRWVPYLQVGTGVLLIAVAFGFMRADLRAHREKLWSAMARELAHQMGTPLSSLSGWVEVLQLPASERDEMADVTRVGHVMQADVERLERVSRRFELIGKAPSLQSVAITDVVDELTAYFRPRLPNLARGVTLKARVQRGMPAIPANQVLLVWALENIVKNAVDALAGRGGRITIVARELPPQKRGRHFVEVVIADNGPGIAASVMERIFEAGFTTKSSGWGVGLSLSRRIVEELHGGRISAENRPGGGTVFAVLLPVARA